MSRTLYFEDLEEGANLEYGSTTLSADQIKAFARDYDPQPFHLDENAARESVFRGLASSGWHTVSLTVQCLRESERYRLANLALDGLDNLRWQRPVRPGDRLTVLATATELRSGGASSTPGSARLLIETRNQADEAVMSVEALVRIARRPEGPCA